MSLFSITGSIIVVDHILNFSARVIISEQIKGSLNGFVELLHKLVVGCERFRVVWQNIFWSRRCRVRCLVLRLGGIWRVGRSWPVAGGVLNHRLGAICSVGRSGGVAGLVLRWSSCICWRILRSGTICSVGRWRRVADCWTIGSVTWFSLVSRRSCSVCSGGACSLRINLSVGRYEKRKRGNQ